MIVHDPLMGPLLVLRHVGSLLAAAALLVLHLAIGAWIARRWFGWSASLPARWAVQSVLGAGAFGLLMLGVAAVGALQPLTVLAITLILVLLLRREYGEVLREARESYRAHSASPLLARFVPIVLAIGFVAMLIIALGPPTDWDSLMYHLRVPKQFLEAGRLFVPQDNFHVALVNVSQFSTMPLVALRLFNGPALMQVAAAALMCAGTFALAREAELKPSGAWAAVFVVMGSPIIALVAVTARVDVTLMLALVAAHLVLLSVRDEPRKPSLILAGVLLGIAVAIKPQAGAYAVALVPVILVASRMRIEMAALVVVAAIAAFLPWALKNHFMVGAVFYPKGAPGWFQPWLAELYGSKVIPLSVDQSVINVLPSGRKAFSLIRAYMDPASVTIETEGSWYTPTWAFVLLPLMLIHFRSHRRALSVALVGLAHVVLVTAPFGQINLRYLMPALPALAIGVALVAQDTIEGWNASRRYVLTFAAMLVAVFLTIAALADRLGHPPVLLKYAVGMSRALEVYERHPDFSVRTVAEPSDAVLRLVPDTGLVLMVNESRGLAFDRPVLADVLLSNWSFASQSPAAANCFAGTGITHMLVNVKSLGFYMSRGAKPDVLRLPQMIEFRNRCVRRIPFDDLAVQLWELRS